MKAVYVWVLSLYCVLSMCFGMLSWFLYMGPLSLFSCILCYVNVLGCVVCVSVSRTHETHLGGISITI